MGWLSIHLKGLRKRAGIDQQQLATRVNVGINTIKNIESGYITAPEPKLLDKMAQTFGVSVEQLLSPSPVICSMEPSREVYVVNEIEPDISLPAWSKVVDVVYVDCDLLRGRKCIGIRVQDNAMLMRGMVYNATVLVALDEPFKNGDVVAAIYEKHCVIREYFSDGKKIVLKASNPIESYPDIYLDASIDKLNIIGKVVNCQFNV